MNINPVSLDILELQSGASAISKTPDSAESFSNILTETMNTASEMDAVDKASTLQLLSGQADDFSGMLLDAQKAEVSLNLALQIRNKVLDAYKEIMNMQI